MGNAFSFNGMESSQEEKQKSMLESIREMNSNETGFDAVIVCLHSPTTTRDPTSV